MRRRRALIVLSAIVLVVAAVGAACKPPPPGPPPPGPCDIAWSAIVQEFAGTGQEANALAVVQRESGCDPCAFYPGQSNCDAAPHTAKGLFQLLGHDRLIFDACPNPWGIVWWMDPYCNARAARWLWEGSGWSPWGG